jgi:hypothetical protein
MRYAPLGLSLLSSAALAADAFVPAPAEQVTLYSATPLPCHINQEARTVVTCKDADGKDLLANKTLREMAIMRNTIFARYGWDGYRKEWLRNYFHGQPWFKPNPKFGYKLLNDADKKNVHFIATKENSFTTDELRNMTDSVYARRGKVWHDTPRWKLRSGKVVARCSAPDESEGAEIVEGEEGYSHDCAFEGLAWYKPNKGYSEALLSADDRIELGLLSRAQGSFALDGQKLDDASASLDRILTVAELRQLSLRDLRYLRNTIYARRGRAFKSKVLQEHFQDMSWYRVDDQYTDAKLTANDNRNIKMIRSVEDELGGPLHDEDWLIDPATDGA